MILRIFANVPNKIYRRFKNRKQMINRYFDAYSYLTKHWLVTREG
tara:strand:+ start:714 stop:848 length:135 start_codon:yes stop_codon:yes gene_type:complete